LPRCLRLRQTIADPSYDDAAKANILGRNCRELYRLA